MTKHIPLFLLFLVLVSSTQAQNLDSLYNLFVGIRTNDIPVKTTPTLADEPNAKCGFQLVNNVKLNFDKFTKDQQRVLNTLLQRPATETSMVTPGGYFRIHYDTTGQHAPGYDLNELAQALDSVYIMEVQEFGYPVPPTDGSLGGDDLYDIYIQTLNRGLYGYTEFETDLPGNRKICFTVIENDFEECNTKGIDGAKVTVAHEYHHAIQTGNYIYRSSDVFYYEITSASMEEFVFDYVNDYYFYLPYYFSKPEKTFSTRNTSLDGYDLAVWNIYLKDRFGLDIIKRTWELMPENNALVAIATAIEEYGSTFKYELNNFGVWTYFTDYRAKPGEYFEEAANYPLIEPLLNVPPDVLPTIVYSAPVSNNFIVYADNLNGSNDTLVSIITNADIANGVHALHPVLEFEFDLSTEYQSDYYRINENYYSNTDCMYGDLLQSLYILNGEPVTGDEPAQNEEEFAYPQPFNYSNQLHNYIRIPVADNESGTADLNIYSVSMNLVYSGSADIYDSTSKIVRWNARDNNGDKLPSGVYIYVTKYNDIVKKGKIVIFNE